MSAPVDIPENREGDVASGIAFTVPQNGACRYSVSMSW
jgi:hypothetical protein